MNWTVFLWVLVAVPCAAIGNAAGEATATWVRKRFGSGGLFIVALVVTVALATAIGWFWT